MFCKTLTTVYFILLVLNSVYMSLVLFDAEETKATPSLESLPVLLYDVTSKKTSGGGDAVFYKQDAINLTVAQKHYTESLASTAPMVSTLELSVAETSLTLSSLLVGTEHQLYYSSSSSSGLTLIYALISKLYPNATHHVTPTVVLSIEQNWTMKRSRAVSLFHAGGLTSLVPSGQRCHYCDQVLASGWNHVMMLSRLATVGSGVAAFSRSWYSPDYVQSWGDDSYKQSTVPTFANTNAFVNTIGPFGCIQPIHFNGYYPLYKEMSCANKLSPSGKNDVMLVECFWFVVVVVCHLFSNNCKYFSFYSSCLYQVHIMCMCLMVFNILCQTVSKITMEILYPQVIPPKVAVLQ